ILFVDAFEFLFQWRLLRGASRLARVVARAAAHRIPAPLAGPVGIFGFVVRESGRGGRQRGRHRQYADQASHDHRGVLPERLLGTEHRSGWDGPFMQSATGSRRQGGPTRQSGFPRRDADLETSGSNFWRDAEGPQISRALAEGWRPWPLEGMAARA